MQKCWGFDFDGIDNVVAQTSQTDTNNSIQTDMTPIICELVKCTCIGPWLCDFVFSTTLQHDQLGICTVCKSTMDYTTIT